MNIHPYIYPGITPTTTDLPPEKVIEVCCEVLHTSLEELKQASQERAVTEKRHVTINLLCTYTGLKLKEIADIFDYADHTPVRYARQNVNNTQELQELKQPVEQKLLSHFVTIKTYNHVS